MLTTATCNFAQLVVDENGTTIVPTFDWTNFFVTHFKRFVSIKQYHHFRFVASEPGVVYARRNADTAEVKVELLRHSWAPDSSKYPVQITPKGLTAERQWYLYEKIREFCPVNDQNVTCPRPTVPRPNSRAGTPADEPRVEATSVELGDDGPSSPAKKRTRTCRTCRKEGHDTRTCPDKQ